VVVLSDSPFHSFKEIIDFARANPGKLTVGTAGAGTTNHVAFQALSRMEGLNINIVPFAGESQTGAALLGGHIMVMSTAATGYARYLRAKKVRLLAMMSEKRMEDYPEVLTLKELGYNLVFQSWFVIIGPKDIEKPIVKKLAETFDKAMQTTSFIQLAKSLESWTKEPLSGDELRKEIIRRDAVNQTLFKKLGMGIN
jgi:tripartite-type tricarboxylate transporter receptor subunit TctC